MGLLIGALTLGFIFSLVALGVFISFRIFAFPDITADGSSTLGAALAAMLLVKNVNPAIATGSSFFRRLSCRCIDGNPGDEIQDQWTAGGHSGDDRSVFRQPSHHGQK
jgi:uncharacterized protein YegL